LSLLLAAIIVAAAMLWVGQRVLAELRAARDEAARARVLAVMQLFSAGIAAARADPRELLTWHPLARAARQLLPGEFASLDAASGGRFPFTDEQVQAAHSQWTADWLAWERMHDGDYKLKAAVVEQELSTSTGSPWMRAKLEAIEREKLDLYQRRYQEYVRVAKTLQSLIA
jgi:hypothetical protein